MTLAWISNLINSGTVKAQGELEFSEQIKDNSNAYFIEIRNTEQGVSVIYLVHPSALKIPTFSPACICVIPHLF